MLGGILVLGAWGAIEASGLPRTAFFGGRRLAEKWVRLEAFEREGPLEVVVVGASHVDQGVDARRFSEVSGERAFNFGVTGTDTYFQSLLLRQLLLTGRRPRTVIWVLLESTLRHSSLNRQYLAAPAVGFAQGPASALRFELGQRLPQFQRLRLLDWWKTLTGALPEPVDEYGRVHMATDRYPGTGAPIEPDLDAAQEPEEQAGSPTDSAARELLFARAYIEETLILLRDAGARVWFVFAPLHASLFRRDSVHSWRMLTRTRDGHFDWIRELAREHGIEITDLHFCEGISPDPALFYDPSHLNGKGSLLLGELLGELHVGLRPVPDDWRGIPSRAHWLAIFGHEPPPAPARLELGARVRLAEHPELFPTEARTDLYATVEIEEPGEHRLVLGYDTPRKRESGCYARVGDGPHRFWRPGRRADAVWKLQRGEQRIELHAAAGTIDWDELTLERVEPTAPRR